MAPPCIVPSLGKVREIGTGRMWACLAVVSRRTVLCRDGSRPQA